MRVCTIIARNYLPQARVLAESFLRNNPGVSFSCLIIDDVDRRVDEAAEPFQTLHLDQILADRRELHRMALHYDVMELATAVKPLLLLWLMETYGDSACYLDPDIEVFAAFDEVAVLAEDRGIVLTPHAAKPIPRDSLRPSEAEILSAGVYNLGFIAVGQQSAPFLHWWWERLQRGALVDPKNQLFTDQRWVDFAPAYFPHTILRDPGYNVAYWNLHGRQVERRADGSVVVDDRPLVFFHYSGYVPEEPWQLSKHQGHAPRVLISELPVVGELCVSYGQKLGAAGRGRDQAPYGYAALADGTAVDRYVRIAYRSGLAGTEGTAAEPPEPFAADSAEEFGRWIRSADPSRGWPDVSRYGWALRDAYPDLVSSFAELRPAAGRDFVRWCQNEARARGGRAELVPADEPGPGQSPGGARPAAAEPAAPDELAVNVAGYLRAELGVGEAGRLAVATLQEAGVRVNTVTFTETASRQQHPFNDLREGAPGEINLLCINADRTPSFAQQAGEEFFRGRYTIGSWFWELEEFPEVMHAGFAHVDEVWVGSSFTRDALSRLTTKPVHAFPPAVVRPQVDASLTRSDLGLPENRPVVLFAFDFFSILERKNPVGLIEAFRRAFRPDEGPVLVLKSVNGDKVRPKREQLRLAVADRADILLMDGYLDHDARAALMASADCYASLHRSEGFGLTMAESMTLGVPVLATGYSGNLDFMNDSNSWLVPHSLVHIPPGCDPYPTSARWAEPDIDAAAEMLRTVLAGGPEVERRRQAALTVEVDHGLAARASWARHRLEEITEKRRSAGVTAPASVALPRPVVRRDGPAAASLRSRLELYRGRAEVLRDPQLRRKAVVRRVASLMSALQERQRAEIAGLRDEVQVLRRNADQRLAGNAEVRRRIQVQEESLSAVRRQVLDQLVASTEATERTQQHTNQLTDDVTASLRGLQERIHDLDQALNETRAALETAPEAHAPDGLRRLGVRGTPTVGYLEQPGSTSSGYLDFEEVFRGPEKVIQARQVEYLELLDVQGPVLDIGCGRGEWLELLQERGIEASGVDSDSGMVERCRSKGLQVRLAEGQDALRELPSGSLGAVSLFQVVEHIDPANLPELFREVHRVLRPGGLLLAETVNPHNTTALRVFWLDLTHRHPLFPESLVMLARSAGYEQAEIFFPGGSGDYDADRVAAGDYALLARA